MKCYYCEKEKKDSSMAIFSGGAMKKEANETYSMLDPGDIGFVRLDWHGDHDNIDEAAGAEAEFSNIFVGETIADNCPNGQFELYFCSTQCLRDFLNKSVDSLEEKMKKKSDPNHFIVYLDDLEEKE